MATSPAGAVGPWQFIPSTGSRFGLSQNNQVDERHDFERSTESAFRYLQELRNTFQNWTLAIAAYNCGENRVISEMRKQRVNDYYSLKLPLETERYIFRILAIKELLQNPENYGYSLPKGAAYPVQNLDRVSISLPNALPLLMLAEAAGVTFREFKRLNPAYISDEIPAGDHVFKVPAGRGKDFQARVETFKASYVPRVSFHTVGKGETLFGIASKYNVSAEDLKKWNGLADTKVRTGQNLKIIK